MPFEKLISAFDRRQVQRRLCIHDTSHVTREDDCSISVEIDAADLCAIDDLLDEQLLVGWVVIAHRPSATRST